MSDVIQQLLDDTAEKIESLGRSVQPDQLRTTITDVLTEILSDNDHDVVRRLRFGPDEGQRSARSKYARMGLTDGDIEMLHDILQSAHDAGIRGAQAPSEELRNAYADVSNTRRVPVAQAVREDQRRLEEMFRAGMLTGPAYEAASRAMDTQEAGFGAELIGAQYVSELWRGARATARVFPQIGTFEMTDPTAYLPVEADLPEMLFVPEIVVHPGTEYATSKTGSNRAQVDAKKFVIHQVWSGEMEEDSIIPFLPFLREQAARSLGHHSDSAVLNGDTTNAPTGNINLDDADPDDTKHYLAFDGIRHAALVDNTNNGSDFTGTVSYAELLDLKGLGVDETYKHDWGHPNAEGDFLYVVDPLGADIIAQLTEVLTVDKYGVNATVQTGEVARIGRHPLISSIDVSRTEADGKVSTTPANNTQSQVVAFNRRGCVVGWRRRVQVETERLPGTDQNRIVYSLRMGFGRFSPTGAASGIEWATVGYNFA